MPCRDASSGSRVSLPMEALLLWRTETDPLPLHLVDNGLGALVTLGREFGGLAGQQFELLAHLDRLLYGGLLRAPQIRERAAVMNSLAGLERHQHEQRHHDKDKR